jgi:hypothetical protein
MFMIHCKYLICGLQGEPIDGYLREGSTVKFSCHGFDESGQDRCGYFVTMAWRQDPVDLCTPGIGPKAEVFFGIFNVSGTVSEVSHRQGVITYVDANGEFDSCLVLCNSGRTLRNLRLSGSCNSGTLSFESILLFPSIYTCATVNHIIHTSSFVVVTLSFLCEGWGSVHLSF